MSIKLNKPLEKISNLERLLPRCLRTPPEDRSRTLIFWGDFSSPYSALAWSQMERIKRDTGDSLKIVFKPILVGGLFRSLGIPTSPLTVASPQKQAWQHQDLMTW